MGCPSTEIGTQQSRHGLTKITNSAEHSVFCKAPNADGRSTVVEIRVEGAYFYHAFLIFFFLTQFQLLSTCNLI